MKWIYNIRYRTEPEQAYPDSAGEMDYFQIEEESFQCRKVHVLYIFQGDILLSEAQIGNDSTRRATLNSSFINFWPDNREIEQLLHDERLIKAVDGIPRKI